MMYRSSAGRSKRGNFSCDAAGWPVFGGAMAGEGRGGASGLSSAHVSATSLAGSGIVSGDSNGRV